MTQQTSASTQQADRYWWKSASPCQVVTPKPGDVCSACERDRLAYNPQFQLACPACGQVAEAGAFT